MGIGTISDAVERLDRCLKSLGMENCMSEWMTEYNDPTNFLSMIDLTINMNLQEVEKNLTDEMLTNLVKERIKFKLQIILDALGG